MTLSLAGVFADARTLWRSERELLAPIAGVFFVVPMLGIVLLLAYSDFPGDTAPEQVREAIAAFYAAMPEAGPIEAFRQGWRRSAGLGWLTLLAAAGATMVVTILLVMVSTAVIGGLAALAGAHWMQLVSLLVTALIGGFAWTALALLRVAAYRRAEPSTGT